MLWQKHVRRRRVCHTPICLWRKWGGGDRPLTDADNIIRRAYGRGRGILLQ